MRSIGCWLLQLLLLFFINLKNIKPAMTLEIFCGMCQDNVLLLLKCISFESYVGAS